MERQVLHPKKVVPGQLPVPHPPLTPFTHEEELHQMKTRHPSFNTTQIRRSRYRRSGINTNNPRISSGRNKSGSGGKRAPISLKDVLSRLSDTSEGEVKPNEEGSGDDNVEVRATSSLPSLSSSHSVEEEKPAIDEVSHIRNKEEREKVEEGELKDEVDELPRDEVEEMLTGDEINDDILRCINSLRHAVQNKTAPGGGRHYGQGESEEPTLVSSHIAGVKDLKAFSRKSQEWRTAGLGGEEFVYAVARSSVNGKWNPYELCVVGGEKARCHDVYFTISAFNVSQIERKGCMTSTEVQRWLWERQLFNKLILIPFFCNFRKFKVFSRWKKHISRKKFNKHRSELQDRLFLVDPLLQSGLSQVQDLCNSVCDVSRHSYITSAISDNGDSTEGTDEISLLHYSSGHTHSLEDFMEHQRNRCAQAKEKLSQLREKIVSIVGDTIEVVAKKEKMPMETDTVTQDSSISALQVLEWRSTAEKLKRFESACSRMVQRLLQTLVMKAVNTLREGMGRSIKEANAHWEEQLEAFRKSKVETASQPFSQSVLDRMVIYVDDRESDGVDEGQCQRLGEEVQQMEAQATHFTQLVAGVDLDSFSDISTLLKYAHMGGLPSSSDGKNDPLLASILNTAPKSFQPVWQVNLELTETTTSKSSGKERRKSKRKLKKDNRTSRDIFVEPSLSKFLEAVDTILALYQQVITSFVPLSRDPRIKTYTTSSKFDFLTRLAEENLERSEVAPDPDWPDVELLLNDYSPYQEAVEFIRTAITASLKEVVKFSKLYCCYIQMVDQCVSVDLSRSDASQWSVAHFQRALSLYNDQVHAMSHMVTSFLVGVVSVRSDHFQEVCLSYPEQLLSILNVELPKLVASMSNQLSHDIKDATGKLVSVPTTVRAFIQFLSDVQSVKNCIPGLGTTMKTITSLFNVAQHFNVHTTDQELALYKSLFPLFRYLESALVLAQATKSENVQSFTTDIKVEVTALLHKASDIKNKLESSSLTEIFDSVSSKQQLSRLDELRTELDNIAHRVNVLQNHIKDFKTIPTSRLKYHHVEGGSSLWSPEDVMKEVLDIQNSLMLRNRLFTLTEEWEVKVQKWESAPLFTLHVSQIQREVVKFIRRVEFLEKYLPSAIKVIKNVMSQITEFKSRLPVLCCLLNPALRFRHWDAISDILDNEVKLSKDMSVSMDSLVKWKVFGYRDAILVISNQATHEEALEKMLKKITNEWSSRELVLIPYKGLTERLTHILGGAEDLLSSLEDSITSLSIIRASKYVAPIKHAVMDWESRLMLMMDTVEYWVMCQKTWLYLEHIFTTTEMSKQLSFESSLFMKADRAWRDTVRLMHSKPTALKAVATPGLLESFQSCHVILEQVFKSLEDYLHSIRMAFPRFNFISSNELLEILSNPRDVNVVQAYLPKLFGNVKQLEVDQTQSKASYPIVAMLSAEGERVEMTRSCHIRGSPEQWLAKFEQAMKGVVKQCMATAVDGSVGGADRLQWCLQHPAQVVITVSQILWTKEVEVCMLPAASRQDLLITLYQSCLSHLESTSRQLMGPELESCKRSLLVSLLTLGVHNRDVVMTLRSKQINSSTDFEWTRHLRYYWYEGACLLRQVCTSFNYGHEYLGSLPRLVVTPLSERCYLTLTTALHLHLGASPIGPAGTGKSETVKDLAKALGQFCVVINCSEELDYQIMGRYFSGLSQSGIWCCFDEFNRINVEVLSVISHQLQCIKTAKDQYKTKFLFEGKEMALNPNCAVFITMNPGMTSKLTDVEEFYFYSFVKVETR